MENIKTDVEPIHLEGDVSEDGTLILQLPPEMRGHVEVTIRAKRMLPEWRDNMTEEEEQAFFDEIFNIMRTGGLGLPIGEILKSPAIGMWADRPETQDSVAWVNEQRQKQRERLTNHE